ncbi:MAG TPA: T9SS type A sorting domain-containing protein, partial [Flavobacteriales bacterium]|nr:T9SS type A sorting domain-containing protein [Flavobacteriales bacterium]
GTYNVTLVASSGAGSDTEVKTGYIVVNPNPPIPAISNSGGTLMATPSTGYNYQWYLNGSPVSGATLPSYTPTTDGDYTVEITDTATGCSSTSAVTTFVGIAGVENDNGLINIYPNPTSGLLTITFNALLGDDCDLIIHNGVGQIVFSKPVRFVSGMHSFEVNVAGLAKGVYTLTIADGNKKYNHKLVMD